jgi:predicted metal-dependent HD superfamily phosphohydrolase
VNWPNRERWFALCRSEGATESAAGWYDRLTQAYAEPQRHYHDRQHIAECLAELDKARHLALQPGAVELALWFHDAVYDPKAADNEERSAALAKSCLIESGMPNTLFEVVFEHIMATKHHEVSASADAGLMVDVDLSILGRDEKRFSEYEQQIRLEYEWVPNAVFASKRAEVLEKFLSRERIYATEWFQNKYERQARMNLSASINHLRQA